MARTAHTLFRGDVTQPKPIRTSTGRLLSSPGSGNSESHFFMLRGAFVLPTTTHATHKALLSCAKWDSVSCTDQSEKAGFEHNWCSYTTKSLQATPDKGEVNLSPRGSLSVVCIGIRMFCIFKIPNIKPRSRYLALQLQPRICIDDVDLLET